MTKIHEQLLADCFILGRFSLCHLLLMNDANYPWFILVPDRDDVREIYQLEIADQRQLLEESSLLSAYIMNEFEGDKLNVAALGNQVPQLHLHHIVRYRNDPSWPTPVWGKVPMQPYDDRKIEEIKTRWGSTGLPGFAVSTRD